MATGKLVAPAVTAVFSPGNSSITWYAKVVENSIMCPRPPWLVAHVHVVFVIPPGFFR